MYPVKKWVAICPVLIALGWAVECKAQDIMRLPLDQPFTEYFDGKAPVRVSGNLIAGVRLGDEARPFQPDAVRVMIPTRPDSGRLCFGVLSRDGRYSAENLYRVPQAVARSAAFEFSTRRLIDLERYGPDSIALLIRDTANCAAGEFGDILPAISQVDRRPSALHVLVNAAPERTDIHLVLEDGTDLAGTCSGDRTTPSLAFAAACRIDLGERRITGTHRLRIGVRERFAVAWREVRLRFDRP